MISYFIIYYHVTEVFTPISPLYFFFRLYYYNFSIYPVFHFFSSFKQFPLFSAHEKSVPAAAAGTDSSPIETLL